MSLPINMYSCCNISVNKLSCGSKSVVISSVSDINNWVEVNFENLNRFADEKKIPDNILKEVSEKVITSVTVWLLANKRFKRDSQRLAFLLCVGFCGYGVMRKLGNGVGCPLTGRMLNP